MVLGNFEKKNENKIFRYEKLNKSTHGAKGRGNLNKLFH